MDPLPVSSAGSELAWDPANQACVWVPRDAAPAAWLPQFVWQPPEDPSSTHAGRAIQAFHDAIARLVRTPEGRAFSRLNEHPDYRAQFDAGYERGREVGAEVARTQWIADYTEMLDLMVGALRTVLSDPSLTIQLFAAEIEELVFRTIDPSRPPVWKNPRYRALLVALRGPDAKPAQPDDGGAGDIEDDVADLVEVAAYADAMRRVPERLWSSKVVERIDLQVGDWVAELTAGTSSLLADVLALNCRPYDQGYLVGSWTSEAIVNTMRRAVEAAVKYVASDPTIPLALMFPPATLTERMMDALIQAVAVEMEDD